MYNDCCVIIQCTSVSNNPCVINKWCSVCNDNCAIIQCSSLCHDKMYLFYISTSSDSNRLPSNTYIIWLLITFFKTLNNVPNERDARGRSCNERVHNHARADRETSVRYTTAGAAAAMIPSTSSTPQQFVQFTSTHTCQSSDVWHVGIIRT